MPHLVKPKVECVDGKDNYARFIAEPLERGFGVTLGNAYRRVLLGSLLGAAVTWVRIEGVQHEFSTIPNVKEDVVEFLLNVKSLRLKPLTKQPGSLFLEVKGQKKVSGGDIKPSADIEVANRELHLATLDTSDAKLSVEFNVMLGKGYQKAVHDSNLPIGIIPVDAIFSPVRRVNYLVVPGHSGYEKLILDVWTDGTVPVTEAVNQGAQILIEQFSPFTSKFLMPEGHTEEKAIDSSISLEQREMPLEQLGFSPRVLNCLRRNKINTVGELMEQSMQDLLALKKLGQKSIDEVKQRLEDVGLALRSEG